MYLTKNMVVATSFIAYASHSTYAPRRQTMPGKPADIAGETYGDLTAVEQGPSDSRGKARWFCACKCGTRKLILAVNLKQGRTRSCGECGAAHQTGIDPGAIRYEVKVWSGVKGATTGYSFGEVIDAHTRALVFRTTPPVDRSITKGEIHPCATRCMTALAQQGLIAGSSMRTGRRWAIEERVSIDVREMGNNESVTDAWYEHTGQPGPVSGASRQQESRIIGTPTTPGQWAEEEKMIRHVFGLDNDPLV
jgi:hypothetical protein